MRICGYLTGTDARLADAGALVGSLAFWRIYFATAMDWDEEIDAVEGALELYDHVLSKPEEWPVISLPLADRHWLRIVYRNFEGDMGMDFLVESKLGGIAPVVAARGDEWGPGMCWQELAAVAQMPDESFTRAQRMLLCLPIVGGTLPHDAIAIVEEALGEEGMGDWADELAPLLAGQIPHQAPFAIRQGVRQCLSAGSNRHVQDMSLGQLRHIDRAFGAVTYRSRGHDSRTAGLSGLRWRYTVRESLVDNLGYRLLGNLEVELRDGETGHDGLRSVGPLQIVEPGKQPGELILRAGRSIVPETVLTPAD